MTKNRLSSRQPWLAMASAIKYHTRGLTKFFSFSKRSVFLSEFSCVSWVVLSTNKAIDAYLIAENLIIFYYRLS
jgi:hypothetical protein